MRPSTSAYLLCDGAKGGGWGWRWDNLIPEVACSSSPSQLDIRPNARPGPGPADGQLPETFRGGCHGSLQIAGNCWPMVNQTPTQVPGFISMHTRWSTLISIRPRNGTSRKVKAICIISYMKRIRARRGFECGSAWKETQVCPSSCLPLSSQNVIGITNQSNK
jgi:hypothetical protein